jgi:hypothetical protein
VKSAASKRAPISRCILLRVRGNSTGYQSCASNEAGGAEKHIGLSGLGAVSERAIHPHGGELGVD